MSTIEIKDLTMTYKSGRGIFDISFTVREGECFGYLGPNGAGKTTTIRQLMGFTNADIGKCLIDGLDTRVHAPEVQSMAGYLPDEIAFFDNMSGHRFLNFLSDMREKKKNRMKELIELFQLDPSPKIKKMSRGMKRKVGLVAAFMHDPDIYILDEPTSGLDPLMQKKFINLILREKQRDKTILMSSHRFDEIELTADRAGILREGHLAAVEDINTLKSEQRKTFIVTLERKKDIEILRKSKFEITDVTGFKVEVVVSSAINDFIDILSRCQVRSMDILQQNLEQVFMKYYGENGEEEPG